LGSFNSNHLRVLKPERRISNIQAGFVNHAFFVYLQNHTAPFRPMARKQFMTELCRLLTQIRNHIFLRIATNWNILWFSLLEFRTSVHLLSCASLKKCKMQTEKGYGSTGMPRCVHVFHPAKHPASL